MNDNQIQPDCDTKATCTHARSTTARTTERDFHAPDDLFGLCPDNLDKSLTLASCCWTYVNQLLRVQLMINNGS